jgi:hypothetical protein
LLNKDAILDNGLLLLKADDRLHSPLAVVHYSYYTSLKHVMDELLTASQHIQCVVANDENIQQAVRFGQTQQPRLHDFADGQDTIQFLLNL